MPVTLTSLLTSGPLLVPLAGGVTLRLEPGETSAELPDVDVADNARIERLLARGAVAVTPVTPVKASGRRKRSSGSAT